uniref:Uncharacterized protein n=1 Tax=Arundo donax TaxID=35708 RepID=A0A0A9CFW3_ARUDO
MIHLSYFQLPCILVRAFSFSNSVT